MVPKGSDNQGLSVITFRWLGEEISGSQGLDERNKSAIKDLVMQQNHVIDFENKKVIYGKDNRKKGWIFKVISIRWIKENANMD